MTSKATNTRTLRFDHAEGQMHPLSILDAIESALGGMARIEPTDADAFESLVGIATTARLALAGLLSRVDR